MILKRQTIFTVVVFVAMCLSTQAKHFRGGTISWKPEGGTKVHFYFNLGWTFGKGPGCTQAFIGKLVTHLSFLWWQCQTGCKNKKQNLANVNYYCTGADKKADWEQGQNNFTFVFPNEGPFRVGFANGDWILLSNGRGGGKWNMATVVDLRKRSDTGEINSSPVSLSKPMYYTQYNCEIVLHIPVSDPDGDTVRCRWANGNECASMCHALPGAFLDEDSCTIHFNSTALNGYMKNGIYGVTLTIEDYPKTAMTMGKRAMPPSDAISSIPLQFLLKTVPSSGPCDAIPRFVPPTPAENEVITAIEGDKVTVNLFADNGNDTTVNIDKILTSGPLTSTQSPVIPTTNRTNTFQTTFTWQTTHKDIGKHIVCASVENADGKSGHDRCFKIKVLPKGCQSSPCKNSGKCSPNNGTYICSCRPGFSGLNCQTNKNIITPSTTTTLTTTKRQTTTHVYTMTTTTTAFPTHCPLEYDCQCVFTPHHHRYYGLWTSLSRRLRDLIAFIFGLPIGLLLSLVTFWMYRHCGQMCMDDTKMYPRPRPQITSHQPASSKPASSSDAGGIKDSILMDKIKKRPLLRKAVKFELTEY